VFQKFMTSCCIPEVEPLLSDEHFSVDGTLIEAWASQKSFRPKDGGGGDGTDFHDHQRKNDTHASATDTDCRLYHKANGREAKLSYMGHVIMENRHPRRRSGRATCARCARSRPALARPRYLSSRSRAVASSAFDYDASCAHSHGRPSLAPGRGLQVWQPQPRSPASDGQPP
jgi:hypothetical protein